MQQRQLEQRQRRRAEGAVHDRRDAGDQRNGGGGQGGALTQAAEWQQCDERPENQPVSE